VLELVDIGANLTAPAFAADCDQVVARSLAAGVTRLVVTGSSVEESRKAKALAAAKPRVLWSTAGVHPHHARACDDATIPALREMARDGPVVAIGECGLDFYRDLSPRPVQERWLEAQLELAAELRLPAFLHERDAFPRILPILQRWRPRLPRAVVHCFTGDGHALRAYLDLDLHVGITGWICDERRGTGLRELVPLVPRDRLMLETDAPYLIPRTLQPRPRHHRNEPMYLPAVLDAVADARGEAREDVARATTATARAFFGI
jgi:TatD DNase family protein